jgi:hypothetical protein
MEEQDLIGAILAVVLVTLPVILSLLLPTYTIEKKKKPKPPRPRSRPDPIAMAIRRLRRS